MPGKKKKSARPAAPDHTDSLRRDIAAASNDPFADDAGPDGQDVDIAAELLASLDARDEAEAKASGQITEASGPPATTSKPLEVPGSAHHDEAGRHRRGSGGVFGGLKDAGEKLLHSVSPSSPKGSGSKSPSGGAVSPLGSNAEAGSGRHGLMGVLSGRNGDSSDPAGQESGKKVSRQKARKQRKDAEAAADRARYEEELKANGGNVDEAALERDGIEVACSSLGVDMHEINPDGHCLYAAVADQLKLQGRSGQTGIVDYKGARRMTAKFMREHPDDFAPFISDSDEKMAGIKNTAAGKAGKKGVEAKLQDHYMSYCDAIETTGVWGGQPEILAMSRALQTQIWVVQAGQPTVKIGQDELEGSHPLLLSYHRKMYGLGEHYNSLHPRKQ